MSTKAPARNPRKELRAISRKHLPHLHTFAIIVTVGLVLAPFTLGIAALVGIAVGAIYMAVQTSKYDERVAGAREAYIQTLALSREFPGDKKIAKFAKARGDLLQRTMEVRERANARKAARR